jgi:hypothetical protein
MSSDCGTFSISSGGGKSVAKCGQRVIQAKCRKCGAFFIFD